MKVFELHNQPVEADTYEASMALNQLLKIGKHAIKIHNMIDDRAEMEAWVAKKIDLAGDYVKKVHGYMQGEKAGLYDDGGLTEDAGDIGNEIAKMYDTAYEYINDSSDNPSDIESDYKFGYNDDDSMEAEDLAAAFRKDLKTGMALQKQLQAQREKEGREGDWDPFNPESMYHNELKALMSKAKGESVSEDANNLETAYKQIAMLANTVKKEPTDADDQMDVADDVARPITKILSTIMDYTKGEQMPDGSASKTTYVDMYKKLGMLANKGAQTNDPKVAPLLFKMMSSIYDMDKVSEGSIQEDAGEGHMSKSTLYHTAKYAIELMDMINKGDDLEGWVQSKLNKAADYLQGVHNYEEYQKLNPYREELDSNVLQKHAGIVQKNIDEILARETTIDDVDTKPGMMRILAKRVNEVEKEMAKENRKNTDEAHGGQHTTSGRSMTKGEMNKREKIVKGMKKDKAGFKKRYGKDAEAVMYATATKQAMKDDVDYRSDDVLIKAGFDPAMVKKYIAVFNDHGDTSDIDQMNMDKIGLADAMSMTLASHGIENESVEESGILYRAGVKKYGKAGMKAIQSAAAKGANHQEIGKIKDKHLKDDEQIEEGLKDWAKSLAMAGVFVAGMAGMGSIQNAIDNSVPAVQAMNTAYEMAVDQGNDELAKMIKNDLSAVKVRLASGKDLNFVKSMQDKYSKFIQTEGLAYESKLAIMLNQQLK